VFSWGRVGNVATHYLATPNSQGQGIQNGSEQGVVSGCRNTFHVENSGGHEFLCPSSARVSSKAGCCIWYPQTLVVADRDLCSIARCVSRPRRSKRLRSRRGKWAGWFKDREQIQGRRVPCGMATQDESRVRIVLNVTKLQHVMMIQLLYESVRHDDRLRSGKRQKTTGKKRNRTRQTKESTDRGDCGSPSHG